MNISTFISDYTNYPVLFIGTGLTLRYLTNSYSWDSLLKKIAFDITGDEHYYLDIKSKYMKNSQCDYAKIATDIESDFNKQTQSKQEFDSINELFYKNIAHGISVSRFKLYIANILKELNFRTEMNEEISELKKARKNISSIITTNYDCMIEKIFRFKPLIGNNILLSNPYGSVYKIHGCVSQPDKIIISESDYQEFEKKYELIRAQLLSLFIHNPIIFIGYAIGDKNIKDILKTIFSYVDYNSKESKKIQRNFLLVEYKSEFDNTDVLEHSIELEDSQIIRINKLTTNNFTELYKAISSLILPVSTMDIRKVQNIVKDIYSGGKIEVSITEEFDELENSDKVLVIGSKNTIQYVYQTPSDMMVNYFKIIEEKNTQIISLLEKQTIQRSHFFPIFAFSQINPNLTKADVLKVQQKNKIDSILKSKQATCSAFYRSPQEVMDSEDVIYSKKIQVVIESIINGNMNLDSVEEFLKNFPNKKSTSYRQLLCAYDLKKYSKES
ncbi:SIR2 family protein [uncultured Desulfovibrio sp.]|uniref:SIR2 family NAD-dependent protein deacylase n=1 Tax=uncultured Desulfovibrio sp. TaxID=167968 RepID=UPI00272C6BF8|nr:SIR2 family protein [uncultured Desulfovibrio sp.]